MHALFIGHLLKYLVKVLVHRYKNATLENMSTHCASTENLKNPAICPISIIYDFLYELPKLLGFTFEKHWGSL